MAGGKNPGDVKFWPGLVLIALLIPALCWFRFGAVNGFAIALTGFLLLVSVGVQFLPELADKAQDDQAAHQVKGSRWDFLGAIWLLTIPFCPFLMWLVGSLWFVSPDNWRIVLGVKAFLCVALPLVCVLPLLKYVRGKAAPYSLLVLVLGTAFPVSVGWASAADLLSGPTWQKVDVVKTHRVHVYIRYRDIETPTQEVSLSDGRVLEFESERDVATGRAEFLVLTHLGVIIGTREGADPRSSRPSSLAGFHESHRGPAGAVERRVL